MPDAGVPPLLEVAINRKALKRGRASVEVIAGLHFTVARGEVICLLGPSGCGKTTALRIVTGLDTAFEGSVRPAPATLKLGVVFQEPRLLPWRTVEENIRFAVPHIPCAALDALLEDVGLAGWRRHRPNQLSGGLARRVALARALAVEPDLLVLDEAFVSLDERNAEVLRDVVFKDALRRGAGILMVTHDVREAALRSDRILLLAPQPTRVLKSVGLATPREERTERWLQDERERLSATRQAFLPAL